jgi:hypothetical protein
MQQIRVRLHLHKSEEQAMVIGDVAREACSGVVLALFVRWLLQLEMDAKWAALAGAAVCAAQPWMYERLALGAPGQPETVMVGVVVVAALGVMQVIQGW